MQQLTAAGVSDEMWLVASSWTQLIGVRGDTLNALRLNHMVAPTAMNGIIVYSHPHF